MERTKEECLALIDETVNYFTEDISRRAIINNRCMYNGVNDNGDKVQCAVGRCLNDSIDIDVCEGVSVGGILEKLNRRNDKNKLVFDELFKDEYKGYSENLWRRLQMLHDKGIYWGENGLNINGKLELDNIKDSIQLRN